MFISAHIRDRRRKVRMIIHLVRYYFPLSSKVTYLDVKYTQPPLLSVSAIFCLAEQYVITAAITKVNQFWRSAGTSNMIPPAVK